MEKSNKTKSIIENKNQFYLVDEKKLDNLLKENKKWLLMAPWPIPEKPD